MLDDPHGNLYSAVNPNEPQYVGLPNPKIDENWNELIVGKMPIPLPDRVQK